MMKRMMGGRKLRGVSTIGRRPAKRAVYGITKPTLTNRTFALKRRGSSGASRSMIKRGLD